MAGLEQGLDFLCRRVCFVECFGESMDAVVIVSGWLYNYLSGCTYTSSLFFNPPLVRLGLEALSKALSEEL